MSVRCVRAHRTGEIKATSENREKETEGKRENKRNRKRIYKRGRWEGGREEVR